MDLEPFRRINPCGYAGLEMTQVAGLGGPSSVRAVAEALAPNLLQQLGFAAAAGASAGEGTHSATSTWLQDVSSM